MEYIISSRRYDPGELILKSKPYMRIIRRDLWDIICACCLKRSSELKRCSSCKIMKYCGVTCQKEAWKDHKFECPFLPGYVDGRQHFIVQLVGNLILKTKGKNWKSITEDVNGQRFSFDGLKYHNFPKMRLPWFRIAFKEIETALKSYVGEENMPDEETLLQLIGKVECNSYKFGGDDYDGWALFIGASKFDHSCVPNANIHFSGTDIQVRAFKKIEKYEKVTFSYSPMFALSDVATLHLSMKHSFGEGGCYCEDCSQPYGQSLLTKILDPVRALPILEETESNLLLAALMSKCKYPMQLISQERLNQLLKKQEGVLGDTNVLRIRLLALKCLLLDGNYCEMREELMTLASWVKLAWGEYFEELAEIYKKLIEINTYLGDTTSCLYYSDELIRLKAICIGKENVMKETCRHILNILKSSPLSLL
ncbi:histone-lysine N-methyltransferase SMYD3-like [Argiope bruennichi]|uniref:Histone-lysine N-methyltransferase SMYD3 like protein n=1 Tax=Argiope bruennichi TaxID=94029 RepID=A0A8T0DZ35_ARGBR|nr:histone-lysine N-methyltransferase SMYD3-like [Argiope bruennichi]KAF8763752.1 Histone-lysine N-methyltransferase SMYD3 like protein [Argiope bruennichi]